MDRLKVIAEVEAFLLKQGGPAYDSVLEACAYRMDDGKKCGVGCLIPDELYDVSFENRTVRDVLEKDKTLREFLDVRDDDDIYLLEHIQYIHDNFYPEHQWRPDWETYLKEKFNQLKDAICHVTLETSG